MSMENTFAGHETIGESFLSGKCVFFVGIGGVGMQALAFLLQARGFVVCGSDREAGEGVARLRAAGIPVAVGHRKENLPPDTGALIYTLALPEDNPEWLAARAAGIPCFSRADLLGYLMGLYPLRIGVAGMHGKSTVTAMASAILRHAGLAPTVASGAGLSATGETYCLGGEEIFLCEACEYRDSFLCLSPRVAVVLNCEMEHTDYFQSEAHLLRSFSDYIRRAETIILPDAGLPRLTVPEEADIIRFGTLAGSDARADAVTEQGGCYAFDYRYRGVRRGRVRLAVPGRHNLQNALAALAVGEVCGVPFSAAAAALAAFSGVPRRLSRIGTFCGAAVYEDYAHHPTEIAASLAALREVLNKETGRVSGKGSVAPPHGRLFCVFQPHTYTRTAAFFSRFAEALSVADDVTLMDIYAAREHDPGNVSSRALAEAIPGAHYAKTPADVTAHLADACRAGDLIVLMGAGDIHTSLGSLGRT